MIARAVGMVWLSLLAGNSPAFARAPLNEWFCTVLTPQFDPAAAIGAFPMETLSKVTEDRYVDADDDGTKRTSVTITAEGEEFRLDYSYAFRAADESDAYGFAFRVEPQFGFSIPFKHKSEGLLDEFGPSKKTRQGLAVFAGPPIYPGGPARFSFERWNAAGVYSANWWSRSDVRYASELCK